MTQAIVSRAAGQGFTLVEVMMTLAIAAVMAGVAYPSYMSQVRKTRRTDAMVALMQVEQAQERWRATHAGYAADLSAPPPRGLGLGTASAGGFYRLSLSTTGAAGYVATATAVSGRSQADDGVCTALAVTVSPGNVQRSPQACWNR